MTEWTKLPSILSFGLWNGRRPSSFHAPQPPISTGLRGFVTSKMRKSGFPGVSPSGEDRISDAMMAV
jgi:hypothetical protein